MSDKITRRALASLASAAPLLAQPPQNPAPLPANPDEELKRAKSQLRSYAEQIAKVQLPVATEPAAHFKA